MTRAALLPALARQALAGTGPIARAHQILAHAMASSFTTAAAVDWCALLIIAFAIRMQMARPQGADRCGKRSTKLALAQRGAARSKAPGSRGGDGSSCPGGVVVSAPALAAPERVDGAGIADMTELARLACGRYAIAPGCGLHLYPLTENWTYRVDAGPAAPVVLRIYRPGGRPPAEILSELAWMNAIGRKSRSLVPDVIPTAGGSLVLELTRKAPLHPCYCVMFSYATGREPAEEELAAWFPELGAITARLHRHARSWTRPSWFRRPRWDVSTTLGGRPHWGPWQKFVTDAEELTQLERLARVVTARLREFGEGTDRFGLVHADLRLANLLVDGERVTVIDFEDCGLSWYLYDLACALTFNEGRADVRELIALWVDGYRQVEPLSADDEKEIDTFLMLRRLMLTAYAGLRHDTELAAEMRANGYNSETCTIAEPYLSRFS